MDSVTHNFTADGYSPVYLCLGGPMEFRVVKNSGTGTITLKVADIDDDKSAAASYVAFDAETTVTDSAGKSIVPGKCWMTVQCSSGSSPDFTVRISTADGSNVRLIERTSVTPA